MGLPNVYDANGKPVGEAVGYETGYRNIKGTWYQFNFDENGVPKNAFFVFTGANCTQTGYDYYYWDAITLPPFVRADAGGALWGGTGDPFYVNVNSYAFYDTSWQAMHCENYSWQALVVKAVDVDGVDASTWKAPFSVK